MLMDDTTIDCLQAIIREIASADELAERHVHPFEQF